MTKRQLLLHVFRSDYRILVAVFSALLFSLGCQNTSEQQTATKEVQAKKSGQEPIEIKQEDGTLHSSETSDQADAGDQNDETGKTLDSSPEAKQDEPAVELSQPVSLFDGKNLDYWEEIEFGGEGEISITDGVLSFEMGDPFTGISSTLEDFPKTNYEVSLEARKTEGVDFFCGLTFPVADSHCTLILGGWGGSDCGLSCIDGKDASSNETNTSISFKKNQWYKIRVRVQPGRIKVWLDDKQIINTNIAGKKISLRGDTSLCEPLGIASFQTGAQYKNIELRVVSVNDEDSKDLAK